jgi:hypothetical protein
VRTRINLAELGVGLALVALGLLAAWEGSHYRIGTLTRMGPGMFPIALGIVLAGLGVAATLEGVRAAEAAVPASLRAFLFIGTGIVGWALLVEPFGLIVATVVLVGLSACAMPPVRIVPTLLLAAALCLIGEVLFITLLGVPLTAFGR